MEYGECERNTGYWAEDLDTQEEGFLDEYEDVFCVYDAVSSAWAARYFKGRSFRKGGGKGKGCRDKNGCV
jgi:hypothetical protein